MVPAGVTILDNPHWADGQATSVQVAVHLPRPAATTPWSSGWATSPMVPAEAWRAVAGVDAPIVAADLRRRAPQPGAPGAGGVAAAAHRRRRGGAGPAAGGVRARGRRGTVRREIRGTSTPWRTSSDGADQRVRRRACRSRRPGRSSPTSSASRPACPARSYQEVEGEEYRGIVKVKVGPITAQYKGEARFVEKDDANHRAVLERQGPRHPGPGQRQRPHHRHARRPGDRHPGDGHHRPHASPARWPSSAGASRRRERQAPRPVRRQPRARPSCPAKPRSGRRRPSEPVILPRPVPASEAARPSRPSAAASARRRYRWRSARSTVPRPKPSTSWPRPGAPSPSTPSARSWSWPWCVLLLVLLLLVDGSWPRARPTEHAVADLLGRLPAGRLRGRGPRRRRRPGRASATPRCSTTARPCPPGTGWSAPSSGSRIGAPRGRRGVHRAEAAVDPVALAAAHRRYARRARRGPPGRPRRTATFGGVGGTRRGSSACTPTTPGTSPAATTRSAAGSRTVSPPARARRDGRAAQPIGRPTDRHGDEPAGEAPWPSRRHRLRHQLDPPPGQRGRSDRSSACMRITRLGQGVDATGRLDPGGDRAHRRRAARVPRGHGPPRRRAGADDRHLRRPRRREPRRLLRRRRGRRRRPPRAALRRWRRAGSPSPGPPPTSTRRRALPGGRHRRWLHRVRRGHRPRARRAVVHRHRLRPHHREVPLARPATAPRSCRPPSPSYETYLDDVVRELPAVARRQRPSSDWPAPCPRWRPSSSAWPTYDRDAIHHFALTHEAVRGRVPHAGHRAAGRTLHNPGLEEARADVIVGGCCILVTLMRHYGLGDLPRLGGRHPRRSGRLRIA